MFGFFDFRVHGEENWRLKISHKKIVEDDAVKLPPAVAPLFPIVTV